MVAICNAQNEVGKLDSTSFWRLTQGRQLPGQEAAEHKHSSQEVLQQT